jgi:hypothetical protein
MKRLMYAVLSVAVCAGAQSAPGTWTPPAENDAVAMDSSKLPDHGPP